MRHQGEPIHVAVGGTLLAIGWGTLLTVLIATAATPATKTRPHPITGQWWFWPVIAISIVGIVLGVWFVAGSYFNLGLPQTATARAMAPDLQLDRVTIVSAARTLGGDIRVLFHAGFQNYGRGDIPNSHVTVVIPDVVRDFRHTNMFGQELDMGQFATTDESLQPDDQGNPLPSQSWTTAGVTFYGKTAAPLYFLIFMDDPPQPFRVRVSANSSELNEPVGGIYELDPRVGLT
jgi:hypothetical protein